MIILAYYRDSTEPVAHQVHSWSQGLFLALMDPRELMVLQWQPDPENGQCEPHILDKKDSYRDHQCLTVTNLLNLRHLEPSVPWAPVLQGWTKDYLQCVKLYQDAGVDLREEPVVGVGSVCRRQDTHEIAGVFRSLADLGLRLHGFGVKTKGWGL